MTPWQRWVHRWPHAHEELRALLQLDTAGLTLPDTVRGTSEGAVQSVVRLEAARLPDVRLFRNNVGVAEHTDESGHTRAVRYGLANDSARINSVLKSSDLVGWRRVTITPDMVGSVIARTVLRECKHHGWKFTGDARETAQLAFLVMGLEDGADACFASGEGTL